VFRGGRLLFLLLLFLLLLFLFLLLLLLLLLFLLSLLLFLLLPTMEFCLCNRRRRFFLVKGRQLHRQIIGVGFLHCLLIDGWNQSSCRNGLGVRVRTATATATATASIGISSVCRSLLQSLFHRGGGGAPVVRFTV